VPPERLLSHGDRRKGREPRHRPAATDDPQWIALYLPVPWPAGTLKTRPEVDQEVAGTRPGDFAADVAALEALVEILAARTVCVDGHPHPVFGRMSEAAWLRWGYLHMDHHLRQFGV
jgi:hypothetical protein